VCARKELVCNPGIATDVNIKKRNPKAYEYFLKILFRFNEYFREDELGGHVAHGRNEKCTGFKSETRKRGGHVEGVGENNKTCLGAMWLESVGWIN
jgi:hypothetical protein